MPLFVLIDAFGNVVVDVAVDAGDVVIDATITSYYLTNNHLSFHASYFGMNYSNITGFILALSLTIQFFSGLLPSSYYEDYVVLRFDPAVYTMIDVNNG